MSNKHGSLRSSPPPENQLQAQILFKYWAGCLAACLSLDFRPWPVSASHCCSHWTPLPQSPPAWTLSGSNCLSICSCFSEYLHFCLSLCLSLVLFLALRLCLGPCCSFSISLLSSPLACSVLTYLHCSISVSHFWSLRPFSPCVSHSLSAPIPLSSDFPCPLLSSQSCFLREAQFLSLRLFLIVSTALLVTSSLSFSVFLLVFLLFHSPTFSRNQMSLLGKSSFQSKGFRVLIKPSCWAHLQALRDWTQSHGGPH